MSSTTHPLSRRDFLRLAGLAGAGAALASCGIRPPASQSGGGPVQLVYQDWRTEWFPAMAQEMLAIFNAENPGIQVFYTPDPENKEEQMLEDFTAGTAPDVFSGCCDFFPAWADAGYLLDLRPFVEADLDEDTISDWSEAQYRALFTREGLQYALPMYHGGLALYYNKDLFDAAGVEYPTGDWTHDEYLDAMHKLTVRQDSQVTQWGSMFDVSWDRIQMHVNGWGGHYVDPIDPKHCVMAAPNSLEAQEWLRRRIWDDKVMANFLDVQKLSTSQAFIAQKVAMVEDGSWALKSILDGANFRIGVAPFPRGPVKQVTLGTTDGFGIYAGTKHPQEAWEFLKFLVSKDYGRAMAQAHFLQPARTSLVPEWAGYIRQEYPEKTMDLNLEAFADGQIKEYSATVEHFPNMVGVGQIAKDAWDQIYTFGKAPVSEMANVCGEIEAIQQQASGFAPATCGCEATS